MEDQTDRLSHSGPAAAGTSPADVAPLAGLQFVAIAWIVLNQFRDHLGLEAGAKSGLVAKGYVGAGLFFVVSGFLLCRQFVELRESGRFRYGSFLWRRLAFLYPLHVVILAAMAASLALGSIVGEPIHGASFQVRDLPANLLLIQAWGVLRTDSWNFPSWLISADWFAYLLFPLIAWVALRGLRSKVLALAVPMALFVVLFLSAQTQGILFTDMTTRIGALQTVPAVLLGAALWRLDRDLKLPRKTAAVLAVGAFGWIGLAASLRLSDLVIWPTFGPLVLGVAATADARINPLASSGLRYLGRISISMLLVYLPVDIAYFRVAQLLWRAPRGVEAWIMWSGVFPVILLAAVIAYHGFQCPLWRWLQAHNSSTAKTEARAFRGR